MRRLAQFTYAYTHGPIDTEEEFMRGFSTGNCRRALQDYLHARHGRFLTPAQIYIPESYDTEGQFVLREGEHFTLDALREGDVIYAQKLRSKSGRPLEVGPDAYDSRDEWLFSLHNAVYLGPLTQETRALLPEEASASARAGVPYVWHATVVEGGTALWEWEQFARFYAPVSAKRLL